MSHSPTLRPGQSYWRLVWGQYRQDRVALAALVGVFLLFAVAIFADLLANDRPLAWRTGGRTYFPAFFSYPEYLHADFKALSQGLSGDDFARFAPVPYSPTEYDLAR